MKRNCQNKLVKANELLMIALLLMAGQYLFANWRRNLVCYRKKLYLLLIPTEFLE